MTYPLPRITAEFRIVHNRTTNRTQRYINGVPVSLRQYIDCEMLASYEDLANMRRETDGDLIREFYTTSFNPVHLPDAKRQAIIDAGNRAASYQHNADPLTWSFA